MDAFTARRQGVLLISTSTAFLRSTEDFHVDYILSCQLLASRPSVIFRVGYWVEC